METNQKSSSYYYKKTNPPHFPPYPAFPILIILGTAFLLITYVFISKCHLNLLRRIALLRSRQDEDHFIALSPSVWNRGLEDSILQAIPSFKYKRSEAGDGSINGCVVCLGDFHEHDMLRVLPNCSHAFHLDCIDIWLQSNVYCPLCRTSISCTARDRLTDHIVAPSSSPQDSQPLSTDVTLITGDEDFVVIELGGQERENFREALPKSRGQSPEKMKQRNQDSKSRKHQRFSIMGDECIDVREKNELFLIQPIRRSFSLDSATDRQLYLSVQAIVQQK